MVVKDPTAPSPLNVALIPGELGSGPGQGRQLVVQRAHAATKANIKAGPIFTASGGGAKGGALGGRSAAEAAAVIATTAAQHKRHWASPCKLSVILHVEAQINVVNETLI